MKAQEILESCTGKHTSKGNLFILSLKSLSGSRASEFIFLLVYINICMYIYILYVYICNMGIYYMYTFVDIYLYIHVIYEHVYIFSCLFILPSPESVSITEF